MKRRFEDACPEVVEAQGPEVTPSLEGAEVWRHKMTFSLIADSSYRGAQVLAATANAMSDDLAKALQAGMDDYISKPFNF